MVALSELIKQALALPTKKKKTSASSEKNKPPKRGKKRARDAERAEEREEEVDVLLLSPQRVEAIVTHCNAALALAHTHTHSDGVQVFEELWHYLQRDLLHRQCAVRLRALELTHALAVALPGFRCTLAEQLQWVVRCAGLLQSLSLEQRGRERVKGGEQEARAVEEAVKEKIQQWDFLFGREHEKFHVMKRYFVESLQLHMPSIQDEMAAKAAEEKQREIAHRRRTLLRAEQVLKKGLWAEEKETISLSVQAIEECFSILFPDMTTASGPSADDPTDLQPAGYENDPEATAAAAVEEQEVDWSAIDWVSAEEDEERSDSIEDDYGSHLPTSHTLPFTIEFDLVTSVEDLSEECSEIVQTVKEHASILVRKSLPRLQEWKDLFEESIKILEDFIQHRNNDLPLSILQAHTSISQAKYTLAQIERSIAKLQDLLNGRCKELLSDRLK